MKSIEVHRLKISNMSLTPGTRVGPYEVTAQIGVGGMGEVYRATDTHLKRAVALKVLPEAVASDLERLARLQHEAEVLAALNHPNITQIYGLEKSEHTFALVMEFVEGPTLANRIAQGPIPVDEALPIAKQIAEAIEAAHARAIVHRDLKPANVKVRRDGIVKVLDFGLAKLLRPIIASEAIANGPTLTAPATTQQGTLLGTVSYMSPEQARGKLVDKRTDVWSFGCVLYEMLTGRRAFCGEDVSDTLAAILRDEPDWTALPADTPADVLRELQECLQKDRTRRLHDIGDVRLQLIASEPPLAVTVGASITRTSGRESKTPFSTRQNPPRLSIVVLPFTNLTGDPEQEYFVDGVTASLTTDLSRIAGAFVIGPSTAFTYKDKMVDLKQIGHELNVRHVLEGSVQRAESRMRVNVQLIEVETGAHLWAERFDMAIADLFEMQDEIVARLANQLRAELVAAEARRGEQTPNPDALDLCFQGRALLNRGVSPDLANTARQFFERALDLDSRNVEALVGLGTACHFIANGSMTDDPFPLFAAAEAALVRALAAAPGHSGAHRIMGANLCATNRVSRGIEELERALALEPNDASARGTIGLACIYLGRAEEAEAHVLEALRLSPRDVWVWAWLLCAGGAKAHLGDYASALPWLRRSVDANRNAPWAFFYLAACLALMDKVQEARGEVRAGLAVNPQFTIHRFRGSVESDNAVFLSQRERVIEGMRLAGTPEG